MEHEGPGPAPARRPASRRRGIVFAVVAVAALAALAWHLTHRAPGTGGPPGAGGFRGRFAGAGGRPFGPPPTTVGVATAATTDLPITLDALGTVTPSATVVVRPQVSGVLAHVRFREGQLVHAGEVLATIDPRPFDLAVMQSRGQLLRDQAQLESATLTLQRYRTLLKEDSIAQQDVDTQAALVKQLQGVVMTDRAAEGTAELNRSYATLRAPAPGHIGLRNVDVGNLVSPSDTTGLATITRTDPIDIEFAIPQDRVAEVQARLATGAPLAVEALDRERTRTLATGRFLSLDNQADVQTATVKAKARFANAGGALFPAQFVNVRLQPEVLHGVVVVPVTALRHGPDGDFVWLIGGDRTVSQRAVVTGPATADEVAVAKGLAPGDRVVTEGGDRLKDGARVTLPGDAAPGGARGSTPGASRPAVGGSRGAWPRAASGGGAAAWRHRPAGTSGPAPASGA